MKKTFLLFLLFIIILISFLLFHDTGNAMSKPYLQKLINEQLDEGEVVVQELNLDLDQMHATLLYNQSSTIELQGDYSLLKQSFDLDYKVALKDFKYKNIEFGEQVDATGHAKGSYNVSEKELDMLYDVNISDLSKLQPMTKQALYGSMLIKGEVKKKKGITSITGTTKELEGKLDFQLENKHFTLQMEGVSVEKIMQMMHYPSVFRAYLKGEGDYNLTTKKGQLNSTLVEAQLLPNGFIDLVKTVNGLDLSKEKFDESTLKATVEQSRVDFDFLAKNSTTLIKLSPAHLETDKSYIEAQYIVEVEGKDVGGKIIGDIKKPHISVDSSRFIQNEVNNVIDKNSEKLKEFGIGEKEQKKVKEFFNSLFK